MRWMADTDELLTRDSGPRGYYRDVRGDEGRDQAFRSNLIVEGCRVLLAGFMASAGSIGPQFLAIGRGLAAWDVTPPPAAPASLSALFDPAPVLIAIAASDMQFLDASGTPSATPTNRIQIDVDLPAGTPAIPVGESSYPMREFGLVGELDGSQFLINYVRHGVIHKGPTDTMVRTIRLVF